MNVNLDKIHFDVPMMATDLKFLTACLVLVSPPNLITFSVMTSPTFS